MGVNKTPWVGVCFAPTLLLYYHIKIQFIHRYQDDTLCCSHYKNWNLSSAEETAPLLAGPRPSPPLAVRAQASRKCTFCTACRGNPLTPMPPADGSFAAIAAEGADAT